MQNLFYSLKSSTTIPPPLSYPNPIHTTPSETTTTITSSSPAAVLHHTKLLHFSLELATSSSQRNPLPLLL